MTNPNYPAGVSDRDIDGEPRVEDVSEREVEITISVYAEMIGGDVFVNDKLFTANGLVAKATEAARDALLKAHADEKAYQRDESEGVR